MSSNPFLDEEEDHMGKVIEEYNAEVTAPNSLVRKPAAEYAEHKWVIMSKAWQLWYDLRREAAYRDPDNFDMYIYNDFYGYGLQEIVENMLVDFNSAHTSRSKDRVQKMWSTMSGLILWFLTDELGPWYHYDDADRVEATVNVIGNAFASVLHAIQRAGQLKLDSSFSDLEIVMSMYLHWSHETPVEAADTISDCSDQAEYESWDHVVVAYAKASGLDLARNGVFGTAELVEKLEDNRGTIEPLNASSSSDRWQWKQKLRDFKCEYTILHHARAKLGGRSHDITRFPRSERAQYNFDHMDPLAGISAKELREGNLMLA